MGFVSNAFKPRRQTTGREVGADTFGQLFGTYGQGQQPKGNLGEFIQNTFTYPGYGKQLTAGQTSQQGLAMGNVINALQAPNSLSAVRSGLLNFGGEGRPNGLEELFAALPQGTNILDQIANGTTTAQNRLGAGTATPERAALASLVGSGAPQATDLLKSLFESRSGAGNNSWDLNSITAALDGQRRFGLDRDVRDIREMFSSQGLRESSNLADAVATRQSESEANLFAELARIAPQLVGAGSSELQALTQLGTNLGSLELGGQENIIRALTGAGELGLGGASIDTQALQSILGSQLQAGQSAGQIGLGQADILSQLFQGQQGRELQALLGLPGAEATYGQLGLDQSQSLFNMGEVVRQALQGGLDRQYQDYQFQNQLFPQILSFLSGAPQPTYAPSPFDTITQAGLSAASVAALK